MVGTNITGTGADFTAGTVTTNANLTGDVTSSGNATTIQDNSVDGTDILIGAENGAYDLIYYDGTDYTNLAKGTANQVLKMNAEATAFVWATDATGRPEAPPTPTSSSDRRFKKNISTVSGALEKLSKLNPVNYNWRNDEFENKGFNDKKQWGFIAQEVEKVMPELVGADEDDYLTLNYNGFVPLLTKAMQEQQTEIDKQQKEIDELKAQLEMIMNMLDNDMSDKTDHEKDSNKDEVVKFSMATEK